MPAAPRTRLYQPTPLNLQRLALRLRRGELVAVPTETVYGLAGDALNPEACARIYAAKGRPGNDPLIIHVHRLAQAKQLAHWNETAAALARAFWPGPLTLVLPKTALVPDITTSGLPNVALRMPAHPVFRRLLRLTGRPLAAPSANPFGYVSPTTSAHVRDGLDGRIPAILEGGPCALGLESTIVDVRDPQQPRVLRPGAIGLDALAAVLGRRPIGRRRTVSRNHAAVAPGLLARHYSPRLPLTLFRSRPHAVGVGEAVVYFGPGFVPASATGNHIFTLSRDGTGASAARRLFSLLRELDGGVWSRVHIQLPPVKDPWAPALEDRLRRAAAR